MADRPVLGIDLGTTYSCVAHLDEYHKASPLPNSDGDNTTPSVVYFQEGGDIVVGKEAKNELRVHPGRVVQHIKRKMGVADFFVELDGRRYYPPQISSKILEQLVDDALVALGVDAPGEGPKADVVITVPAYFGAAERAATTQAGEIAGLNVVSIINEPTAAAVAYGVAKSAEARTVLVYDLGGGTFDVTVVQASPELVRAVATGGDRELGGADWDEVLRTLVLDRHRDQCPEAQDPTSDEEAMGALDILVEDIKKSLTKKTRYSGSFTADAARATIEISREEFEEHTADLVERTMHYSEMVLDAAAAKGVTRLDEVIMVGGMSRVPIIATALAERLRKRFPDAPEPRIVDPDLIVAKGAALFATGAVNEQYDPDDPRRKSLAGQVPGPSPALINIASRGYGIKAVTDENDRVGYVEWLIRPNDELPAAPRETFRTVAAGQTTVEIVVYQSESNELNDDLSANEELVRGDLTGLAPGKPAGQPLEVTFGLGDEGMLEIVATGPAGQRLRLEYQLPGAVPAEELAIPLPNLAKY